MRRLLPSPVRPPLLAFALGACLAGILAPLPAAADEVVLRNGRSILGKASRVPGWVRVELESGSMAFPEDFVVRIVPGISPAEAKAARREAQRRELESRIAAAGLDDAQRLYGVAEWCRREGLDEPTVAHVLGLVLGADPDHAGARADRGEVVYAGRWVDAARARELEARDHAAAMRARGLVELGGEWLLPDEARWNAELERVLAELDELERENDSLRRRLDDAEARLSTSRSEAEQYQADAEQHRSEAERHRADADRYSAEAHRLSCELDTALGNLGSCQADLSSRIDPSECSAYCSND